jgi:hypothetical protein
LTEGADDAPGSVGTEDGGDGFSLIGSENAEARVPTQPGEDDAAEGV